MQHGYSSSVQILFRLSLYFLSGASCPDRFTLCFDTIGGFLLCSTVVAISYFLIPVPLVFSTSTACLPLSDLKWITSSFRSWR